jgi:hypothetical protein
VPFADKHFETGIILKVIDGDRPRRPEVLESTDPLWLITERCWHAWPLERPSLFDIAIAATLGSDTGTASGSFQEKFLTAQSVTNVETPNEVEDFELSDTERDLPIDADATRLVEPRDTRTESFAPARSPVVVDSQWLMEECQTGRENASLLHECLDSVNPKEIHWELLIVRWAHPTMSPSHHRLQEVRAKCKATQELVESHILWVTASADSARQRALHIPAWLPPSDERDPLGPAITSEERLLRNLLVVNDELLQALGKYDSVANRASALEVLCGGTRLMRGSSVIEAP